MSFEEQFDKIINQKIDEAEFQFDEKNWEKARVLIDSNRPTSVVKTKTKNIAFLSLLLISVVGIAVFSYVKLSDNSYVVAAKNTSNNPNEEIIKNKSDNRNSNSELSSEFTNPAQTESNNPPLAEKFNVSDNANATPKTENNDVKASSKLNRFENKRNNNTNNNKETKSSNTIKNNTLLLSASKENVTKLINSSTSSAKVRSTSNQKEAKIPTAKNSNADSKKYNELNNNSSRISSSSSSNNNNNNNNNRRNNNYNNNNNNGSTIKNSNKTLALLANKKSKKANPNVIPQNVLQSSSKVAYNNTESNLFESMLPVNTNLESLAIELECENLNANFESVYDGDYYKKSKPKFGYLTFDGGSMYLLGWNANKGKDATGFNYYAGVNYGIYINSKISISLGVQGYNISNINQPFYSASKTVYDFGATGSFTSVTTNALYYISVPLKFNYSITKNDKVGLGFASGFLVGGKNTVETYSMSDGVKSNPTTIKNKGYYENVNTKNFTLSVLYARKLNKRFALNGEFIYGISDVYLNTKTNITKQNIMGLKLGLTFTLFDK
jgi:hypothetical protein